MKVAITGGTGFVGRHAAEALRRRGHEPVPLSRRVGVDVRDEAALERALKGCGAVLHCAGINRELGAQSYEAVHVDGTARVIEAARRAGVGRIALMSFLRARPGCGSGYHESKWAAEELVRGSGLDYAVIKAGVIYGRGDHLLDHLSRALYSFPFFGLVGLRDRRLRPVAVEDVAEALAAAVDDARLSGRTVAVVGPEELSLLEIVSRVGEAVGRRPLFVPLPVRAHLVLAWVCERLMRVPLVSLAQVRILSESLSEPLPWADELPEDLRPRTRLERASIERGLPPPGGFDLGDLRFCRCGP